MVVLAFWRGPFLQPPSDPVYHASSLWNNSQKIEQPNSAVINKAVFRFFSLLCKPIDFEQRLRLIHFFVFFQGFVMGLSIYFSSKMYGINSKYSLFCFLMFILFFGTNRFSYFSYYVLSPSFVNLSLFFIFSSLYYRSIMEFRYYKSFKKTRNLLLYSLIGICYVPVVYYNHKQEAAFFVFLYLFSFFLICLKLFLKSRNFYIRAVTVITLSIFFLPTKMYHIVLTSLSIPLKDWNIYVELQRNNLFFWGYSVFPRWDLPRFHDTMGLVGYLPLITTTILLIFFRNRNFLKYHLIYPWGIVFWVLATPLPFYVWSVALTSPVEFWRIAYISQYWVPIAFFLQFIENYVSKSY